MLLCACSGSEDEEWEQSSREHDHNWINVTDLEQGREYEFRVVAVNGAAPKVESRSDPEVLVVGPKKGEYLCSLHMRVGLGGCRF